MSEPSDTFPEPLAPIESDVQHAKTVLKSELRQTGNALSEGAGKTKNVVLGAVKQLADAQLQKLSHRAAEYATATSAAAQRFREDGEKNLLATPAERVGEKLTDLSSFLSGSDASEVLRKLTEVARRRPELFLGGLFLGGLILGRFLKASAR